MKQSLQSLRLFFLVGSAFLAASSLQAAHEIGKIAAVVNDHIISVVDLNHRIQLSILSSGLEETPDVKEKLRENVLNMMINEVLQLSMATQFELKPTDVETQNDFDEIESRNNMSPGQLKKLLAERKIPVETIYRQIQANSGWQKYIYARYADSVQVPPQEIERAQKQLAIKKDQPQILLGEIFLSTEGNNKEQDVQKQAAQFVQELRKGAPFPALAQQFSQSASAARGGDIGWVTEDQLDPLLATAVATLKINEISEPLRTPNGYTILVLRDRRAAGESIGKDTLISFNQVVFPASQPFTNEKLGPIFEKAQRMRGHAKSCGLLQTLVKGDKSIQLREVKKAHVSELIPQLKSLLLGLSVNQPSEPVLSDLGFVMFMVCAKEDINPDNLSTQEVQGRLFEQKLTHLAQRELRNLRRSAHIDIRPLSS